jgi:hypothetical protein
MWQSTWHEIWYISEGQALPQGQEKQRQPGDDNGIERTSRQEGALLSAAVQFDFQLAEKAPARQGKFCGMCAAEPVRMRRDSARSEGGTCL